MILETDLIINPDGSVYHLHLRPEQIAQTIITVGDPERVGMISARFDSIEHKVQHREFATHTGTLQGKPLTVISTGIGTDNMDIVLNELDALVNINLITRTPRDEKVRLNIVRIGTSGSIQKELPVDSLVISTFGVGLDTLMHFYQAENTARELTLADTLMEYFEQRSELLLMPYIFEADQELMNKSPIEGFQKGISVTCPGFYAPQGRLVRGKVEEPKLLAMLSTFRGGRIKLTHIEMETSALYGLCRLFGHRAISFNAILANRVEGVFSERPAETVDRLIEQTLDWILKTL